MLKGKKKYLLTGAAFFLIIFCVLGFWKRRGIRNTVYRMLDIAVPVEKEVYGYYRTAVDVDADADWNVSFQTEDGQRDAIVTDIMKQSSLVSESREADREITAESESGNYSLENPLVILNPYRISPLTGVVVFQTAEECRVRVTVKGKTEAADITGETAPGTEHRVPLIGLYPGTANTVELELLSREGESLERTELSVLTDGLPDVFENMIQPVTLSGESAYGMTIVSGQSVDYPFAYDVNGDIRWYLNRETASYGVFHLANDRLIFQDKDGYIQSSAKSYSTVMYEMDYLGRAYQMYFAPNGTHHEIIEKEPGGNLLVLTNTLEDYIEERIMEIDRMTGEVVNNLGMTEIFGTLFTPKTDWAHLNTISYNPEDDTILISPRNLHSGVKINWTTHEIVWILSNPKFWEGTKYEKYVLEPEEEFMWHYQQHTVYEIEEDLDNNPDTIQISLFDNHTQHQSKVSFFEKSDCSYVTVYAVNEKEKTVSLLKKIPVKLSKVTSNTVYDAGSGHIFGMCGSVVEESGDYTGMTYEFDYETEEILNQYYIKEKFYRAVEMTMDYEDMSQPMEVPDNYITGSLRPALETDKEIPEPEQTLEAGISFRMLSQVLFAEMANHHVPQIIFKGDTASYVYDMSFIRLYDEVYLQHMESVPIPLMDMKAGTYRIYCVYMDEYYDTGASFEKTE